MDDPPSSEPLLNGNQARDSLGRGQFEMTSSRLYSSGSFHLQFTFFIVMLFSNVWVNILFAEELGCFRDKPKDRAMEEPMLKSLRKDIDWLDMSKTVRNCSVIAKREK